MTLTIRHDQLEHRFYVNFSGKICELKYKKIDNNLLDYYGTFVPEPLRGQGIAGEIVAFALNYAKSHQYQIVPSCSFVEKYIREHPEHSKIVKGENEEKSEQAK